MRTTPASSVAEGLAQLLAGFGGDPAQTRRQLRNLSSAEGFVRIALEHLARGAAGPEEIHLAQLLGTERDYVEILSDPDQLSDGEAIAAAAMMAHGDSEFHRKLLDLRRTAEPRRILRILQMVSNDEQGMPLVPWLRELVEQDDARLASKAAKILSRLTRNPMAVHRFLHASDARVRANAVEGLWGGNIETTRRLLHIAASDIHHRVVANALVELYRHGDPMARPRIEELAGHADSRFRAAIAWAIGEIGSLELLPVLQPLERDTVLAVRLRAGRTAKKLQSAGSA